MGLALRSRPAVRAPARCGAGGGARILMRGRGKRRSNVGQRVKRHFCLLLRSFKAEAERVKRRPLTPPPTVPEPEKDTTRLPVSWTAHCFISIFSVVTYSSGENKAKPKPPLGSHFYRKGVSVADQTDTFSWHLLQRHQQSQISTFSKESKATGTGKKKK